MSQKDSPPSKQARLSGGANLDSAAGRQQQQRASTSGGRNDDTRGRRIATRRPSDELPPAPPRPTTSEALQQQGDDVIGVNYNDGQQREDSRGRGGCRGDLATRPENVLVTRVQDTSKFRLIDVMANFIKLEPMKERHIYQYRIEYEPDIESKKVRQTLFREGTKDVFAKRPGFDGMHDIYCSQKLEQKETVMNVEHPLEKELMIKLKITCVRQVDWNSFEMMRCYNMHMKKFLHLLEFYQITATGSWVHSELSTPIGDGQTLAMMRGYRTSANAHDGGNILVNLESVHKLMQRRNVLEVMTVIKNRVPANLREALNAALIGKLVITNYNKRVYRIDAVRFDLTPKDTFTDKREDREISYIEYFKSRHNETISQDRQPLLQVVPNNQRGKSERGDEGQTREILLVPELCNITGLTEDQRTDNRLKFELLKVSQVSPSERVSQIRAFLAKFHNNVDVCNHLSEWGYSYERDPVKLRAHVLPVTKIGFQRGQFNAVHPRTADFNLHGLARIPTLENLCIITTKIDLARKSEIITNLKRGFEKVKLRPGRVNQIDIQEGDAPSHYISYLRALPKETTAVVVIMHNQNKERYDSIKKIATVERGLVTQVVTAKLMLDPKKVTGASIKIAIQIAAKIGGEPWWSDIPLKRVMICGYDTFRDTAKRGLNYGAFLASTNDTYSRWFSTVDAYDNADQISSQIAQAFADALKNYQELNNSYPERVFIYRDGVGEGGLATVYEAELAKLCEVVKLVEPSIRLTMTVVNKRTGARFYMCHMNDFANPPPGSVIDSVVTRNNRFDFYLVSQSTRQGTVSPTYYNIIHDESNMEPQHHQMLAYKLSLMYYNWSGTVRVPAPCQYAHKLAALCGENLHSIPNAALNDRLHFL